MRLGLLFACCITLAASSLGQPLEKTSDDEVKVTKLINRNNGDRYLLLYLLSDDQFRYERGYFKKKSDSDEMIWTVIGRYRYRSPEGEFNSYKYSAGENGFKQQAVNTSDDPLDVVNRIDPKALASLVG
ncbi:uncharacterized protein LOC120425878 [Culex pipiens pallens]|uniref:uncharacterized protein LOC120425878 n=1 Tax=Culex pipiens pallens TaxID=42434 RepID=UPI0022AA9F88|nr:uncharacterized protein LOC120425878 [Culex pipiens pallens]